MRNAGRNIFIVICALIALGPSVSYAQAPPPPPAPPTAAEPPKADLPIEFPVGPLAPFEKHPIFIKVLIKAKNEKERARLERHRSPYEKWALTGGKHLPNTDIAFRLDVGWPSIALALHYPISSTIELIPVVELFYGFPVENTSRAACCGIGNSFGSKIRFFLWEESGFHLSLLFEAAILLKYNMNSAPGYHPGMRAGAGIHFSFDAAPTMDLIGGLEIPVDFYFSIPVVLLAPLRMVGGIEYSLSKNWLVFFKVEASPGFNVVMGVDTDFGFGMTGRTGIAYRFMP